jgi:hypothetical protein
VVTIFGQLKEDMFAYAARSSFYFTRKSSQHLLLVLLPPCTLQGCQKTRTADESNKKTGNLPLLFPFIVLNGFHWKMTKEG